MTENLPQQIAGAEPPKPQGGGYSDQETESLYSLARLFLMNGDLRRADTILSGLIQVSPRFIPGLLGKMYLQLFQGDLDAAIETGRGVLKQDPGCVEAILYLVACHLSLNDYHAAGTLLGEAGERIEGAHQISPALSRFYQAQLVRFQAR